MCNIGLIFVRKKCSHGWQIFPPSLQERGGNSFWNKQARGGGESSLVWHFWFLNTCGYALHERKCSYEIWDHHSSNHWDIWYSFGSCKIEALFSFIFYLLFSSWVKLLKLLRELCIRHGKWFFFICWCFTQSLNN